VRAGAVSTLGRVAALACFVMVCAGCSPTPATAPAKTLSDLVVVQLPIAQSVVDPAQRLDLDARYPLGSRVIRVRPGSSADDWTVLSRGFATAGAPAVSPDGSRVMFAGRRTADARWGVYECSALGSKPRKVIVLDRDCGDPAYLTADRWVVVCAVDGQDVATISGSRRELFTATRSRSNVERITFGVGSASDPSRLGDGRILFSMKQGLQAALFTVNPDGSMIEPFFGSHQFGSIRSRPRATTDGGVVFIATDPDGNTRLERVETRRPLATARTLVFDAGSEQRLADLRSAEPMVDGGLLLTGRMRSGTGSARTSAVFRTVPGVQALQPVFDDPAWDEVEAVALSIVEPPRGKPSGRRTDLTSGKLILYDANRSDGVVGPSPGTPRAVELVVQAFSEGRPQTLGVVPLEADGSLFAEVPPDRPIRVRSVDANGAEISTSAWFWVRPGETRACFGCHESRESAPVNRRVLSTTRPPISLVETTVEVARR